MKATTTSIPKAPYPYYFWIISLMVCVAYYWFIGSYRAVEGSKQQIFHQPFTQEEIATIVLYQQPGKKHSNATHHNHEHENDPHHDEESEQESDSKHNLKKYKLKQEQQSPLLAEDKIPALNKIVLQKKEKDQWVSQSHYSAYCTDSVSELFTILFPSGSPITGEVRAINPKLHHIFHVEAAQGIHLILKNKQGKNLTHLILGKDDLKRNRTFLRDVSSSVAELNNRVMLCGPSLRSFLNMIPLNEKLSQKTLIDLSLVSGNWLKKNNLRMTELILITPISHYEMFLKTYFPPQVRGNKIVSEEWLLRSPFSAVLNESFESIVKVLSDVIAEDVAYPPTDLKKHNLKTPPFEARITYSGPESHQVAFGYNLSKEGKWIGRFLTEKYAYQFSDFDGKSLFGSFSDYINLHPLGFSPNAIQIKIQSESLNYQLEKQGRRWILKEPAGIPLSLKSKEVEEILANLADLRPANIVTKVNKEGVFSKEKKAEFVQLTLPNQTQQILEIGPLSFANSEETFVYPTTRNHLYTAKSEELSLIFLPLSQLLDLTLFKNTPALASQIQIEMLEKKVSLSKTEDLWRLENKTVVPSKKVSAFLQYFAPLVAEELLFSAEKIDSSLTEKAKIQITYLNERKCFFTLFQAKNRFFIKMDSPSLALYYFEISKELAEEFMQFGNSF